MKGQIRESSLESVITLTILASATALPCDNKKITYFISNITFKSYFNLLLLKYFEIVSLLVENTFSNTSPK